MRSTYCYLGLMLFLSSFLAVSNSAAVDLEQNNVSSNNHLIQQSAPCGTAQTNILWAGQNINAGSVTISNDATNLYVTYSTTGSWMLRKVHLYVGPCSTIPTNNAGNPTIGLFPYSQQFSPFVSSFTFTIPLTSLTDTCFCVAAHAELVKIGSNGGVIQAETGWAGNSLIGGNSWARKFKYCIQDCTEICGTIQANPLWAGQNISAGSVFASNDATNLYVTYSTSGNWMLRKVHLYVGPCNSIPTNNAGNPTIGLFPYSQQFNPYVSTYTVTIPLANLTADCFCVAAHAELVLIDATGAVIQQETGWAGNTLIGGNSWARKFEYCIQDCQETCEMNVEIESINASTCANGSGSVVISANGGVAPYTFTIVNTSTGVIYSNQTGIFNNISAGNYLAFVHDINLCQPDCQNTSFTIELQPSSLFHTVDIVGTCTSLGSTITLNPSGSAGPFLYSIDGTFVSSNQFVNINSGTYNTVVLDANGCSSSLMIFVSPLSSPILSIQSVQHATCSQQNGSILMSASSGVPNYTFVLTNLFTNQQWNNSSGLFTNLPSGSYAAHVVDANGCKNQHASSVINVQNLMKNCHQVNVCKVDEQNNLIVYPNPASQKATLYVERELSDNLILTITDQNGKVVYDQTNIDLKKEFELDISQLIPGTYYVDVFDIKSDTHLMTRLIVIPD